MNSNRHYIISKGEKKEKSDIGKLLWTVLELLIVAAVIAGIVIALRDVGLAEDGYVSDGWVICKPGDYVNVRETPRKAGEIVGRFECGDRFRTDWVTRNGYLHVYVSLEVEEAWIHCGYVSAWEPEWSGEVMAVSAEGRVALRKYQGGPRTGWAKPGTAIQVYYSTPEWCVTTRGWIRTEFLEAAE